MTASPLIDQLAANVRERSAADRPPDVDVYTESFASAMQRNLRDVVDLSPQQLGAVLLVVAGMIASPETPADSRQGTSNFLAVTGEALYHGRVIPAP